ncbi:hypothetical protein HPP92_015808 [Vanilla planifolia]|uniref:Uncharacterized protein n=1 Tax=Vanilla planifolia TaxID=51239 RepID=A0A835UW54_VANPL|nr:hypothetical protein HPP92_015808 [Vanilla planifolia]
MEWLRRMVGKPRAAVPEEEKPRVDDKGILMLQGEILSCKYQDILVMWEMLQNSRRHFLQDAKHEITHEELVTSSNHYLEHTTNGKK